MKIFTKGDSFKSTIEQQLIAKHWAVTYFRPHVYEKHFLVRTDYRPRMRLDLEEYDFKVEYLRGKIRSRSFIAHCDFNDFKEINNNNDNTYKVTTRQIRHLKSINSQTIKGI